MVHNSKNNPRDHEYKQMANLSKSHATCEAARIWWVCWWTMQGNQSKFYNNDTHRL